MLDIHYTDHDGEPAVMSAEEAASVQHLGHVSTAWEPPVYNAWQKIALMHHRPGATEPERDPKRDYLGEHYNGLRWLPREVEALVKMHAAGMTHAKIAAALGRSPDGCEGKISNLRKRGLLSLAHGIPRLGLQPPRARLLADLRRVQPRRAEAQVGTQEEG